jgi:hypothetical protein
MKKIVYKKTFRLISIIFAMVFFACDAGIEVDKTFEEILAAQPTVESFSPSSAPIQSLVTVKGTNLNFVTKAYIGAIQAEIYSRENSSTLIIKVPANTVNGMIRLTTDSGKEASATENLVITYPVPVIESQIPTISTVNEVITITGQQLQVIKRITFGTIDGIIEYQDNRTIIVKTPNTGPSPLVLAYSYNTVSGEVAVPLNSNYTVDIPSPEVTGFPKVVIKNTPVQIGGTDMNLVTGIVFGTTAITAFDVTPTSVSFAPPADLPTGFYVIKLIYGGALEVLSPSVAYINRDIQTYFNFEAQGMEVITTGVAAQITANQLNGTVNQPPFPNSTNYHHLKMLSPIDNGSSIAFMRFSFATNTTWKTAFNAGAFNNNPVLHFWINTNNTTPTIRLYATAAASKKLVHYNTGGQWKLVAVRLKTLFPTVTAADFVSGNYMRINYLTDNQANVPLEINTDWFIMTDEVLTGVGAIDLTGSFN